MGRPLAELALSEDERETLVRWSRRSTSAQNLAQRCRIVLGCADGKTNQEVAAELGIWPQTVGKWRRRFNERRLEGLVDEPRPGAPRTIGDEQIEAVVVATLERTPKNATHWSRASMAAESGLSESTVGRIWKAFNLKPHQVDTFKLFDVGADLSPPVKAPENGGATADGDGKQDAITPLRITPAVHPVPGGEHRLARRHRRHPVGARWGARRARLPEGDGAAARPRQP